MRTSRRLALLLIMTLPALAGPAKQGAEIAAEPVPRMRVLARDWQYFKAVPCSQVKQLVFHSRTEEILIARRKRQCLEAYKAFFPKPIER